MKSLPKYFSPTARPLSQKITLFLFPFLKEKLQKPLDNLYLSWYNEDCQSPPKAFSAVIYPFPAR